MTARVEGNQTTQFEYDCDNRLVKITYSDGSVIKFGYDGLGRRVWRQDSVGTRYFYYDGDRIIAEREGNTWVVRYLMGISPVGFVSGGALKVYHADRLGSVRWVTDANQNILISYVYEGFGKIVGQNGGGGGPYQWCGLWGYRNDWDAGLMHIGARYYEVETGRWVQKDPILGNAYNPQTLNLYGYCINTPLNLIDPKGLWYAELSFGGGFRIFSIEISIAYGTKPGGGTGWVVSVEFEIGLGSPIDVNLSGSMGDLESGLFQEVDLYYGGVGGEFGEYIGGGRTSSIGIGTTQIEFGVGYTWIL